MATWRLLVDGGKFYVGVSIVCEYENSSAACHGSLHVRVGHVGILDSIFHAVSYTHLTLPTTGVV